jgi:hypothetical protein
MGLLFWACPCRTVITGMACSAAAHAHTVGCDSPSGCMRGCMLHCELMMNEGTKRNSSATFVQACHTLLHMQQHYQVAQVTTHTSTAVLV